MVELINKTGIPEKTKDTGGVKLSEFNSLNSTVNSLVGIVNMYLKKYCDVNAETGNNEPLTLSQAIGYVSTRRRTLGMTVRYLESPGVYKSVVYVGRDLLEWNNLDNWAIETSVIDGGIWE